MSSHNLANAERKWVPPQRFGNYILEREIDGGGMGIVYKGSTVEQRRTVAIKFLLESSQYKRFQREIDTGKRIHHPNFVRYYDTGEIDGHFYIVMDFIDGAPLKKYMEQVNLTPDKRLELFYKIVAAIAYAHQCGIIHRDLKPANIMITRQGEPIILDFGLAKYLQVPDEDATALTMEGQIIGTPGYMSPEQARGEIENQDERTDIFALGIILFEMLTARNPFEGANFLEVCYNIAHRAPANIEQILPGIPPQLSFICNKALAREKEDRYQTAQEFADDIKAYLIWRQKARDYPTMNTKELRAEDITPAPPPPNIATSANNNNQPTAIANPKERWTPPVEVYKRPAEESAKKTCAKCNAINFANQDICQNCKAPLRSLNVVVPKGQIPIQGANEIANVKPQIVLRKPLPPAIKPTSNRIIPTPPPGQISFDSEPVSYRWVFYIFWILLGMIMMPVSMMPVMQDSPIFGHIFDIIAGALASYLLLYCSKGLMGGIIFTIAAILSWCGKYITSSIPTNFIANNVMLSIIALTLAFLLGVNLGLISKKISYWQNKDI